MSRIAAVALGCAGLILAAASVGAQPAGSTDASGGGLLRLIAHKHAHLNGHDLLGDKLKHDGKHTLGKLHNQTVTADVRGGKVVDMAAGSLPVKHVKSPNKMAARGAALIRAAWGGSLQPAQYDSYYYAYCFDDGVDYTC